MDQNEAKQLTNPSTEIPVLALYQGPEERNRIVFLIGMVEEFSMESFEARVGDLEREYWQLQHARRSHRLSVRPRTSIGRSGSPTFWAARPAT